VGTVAAGMALWAFALLTAFAVDATSPLFVKQKRGIVVEAATTLTQAADPAAGCPSPGVDVVPKSAGLAEFVLDSQCRKFQTVRIRYAGLEFIRSIDEQGRLEFMLDCIAGDSIPVDFVLADGSQVSKKIATFDLDRVTKIAVVWSAPVNLDLHAFEYAALPGSPGHVWQGAHSSADDAKSLMAKDKRGHGFISTTSSGKERGSKLEVYTFWQEPDQKAGVINMALDYESRASATGDAETCGTGLYSDLEYEAVILDRDRPAKRAFAKFASLDCAVKLSGPARYSHKAVPEITIRNQPQRNPDR
jgi:hypothetical protein